MCLIQFVIQLQNFVRKYFKTKACTRTAAPEALRTPVRHRWLGNTNCHRSAEARPIYIFFALDLLRMQKGRETERKRHPNRRNVATTITITRYYLLASSLQTWHCVYACVYGGCMVLEWVGVPVLVFKFGAHALKVCCFGCVDSIACGSQDRRAKNKEGRSEKSWRTWTWDFSQ